MAGFNVGLIRGLQFHRSPCCAVMSASAAVSTAKFSSNEHPALCCLVEHLVCFPAPMNQHLISPPPAPLFLCHSYLSHSWMCIEQLHCNMLTRHMQTWQQSFLLDGLLMKGCCWAHYYIFRLLITFQLLKQICYIECLISLLNCSRWMLLWLRPASTSCLSIKERHRHGEEYHALVAAASCSTLVN